MENIEQANFLNDNESPETSPAEPAVEIKEKDYNILEIGCGEYPFFLRLKDGVDLKNAHYIGVDVINEDKLNKGRKRAQRKAEWADSSGLVPEKVDFVKGYFNKQGIPFKEGSFNEIIFRNVFGDPSTGYHDIVGFLEGSAKALKGKGKMAIIETYSPSVAKEILGYPAIINVINDKFQKVENFYEINEEFEKNKDNFISTFEKKEEVAENN
ncbi:hypothetical protein A3J77_02105 [Candidatus Wolfebacteria bacterium RBG_13_41_7]|uniref:Methyltransferase domain-containing protein n=1 Tax=Candidatus Wolfebacteria bacterium RBG_13_41_7 TaxID=1802554 RepID=A0A1F8DMP2_9BACT|nr:MAG: hypothetical protein A3J77_02105 [Candidatus Wolfebacteria bacterium RBG_13_41_7]